LYSILEPDARKKENRLMNIAVNSSAKKKAKAPLRGKSRNNINWRDFWGFEDEN